VNGAIASGAAASAGAGGAVAAAGGGGAGTGAGVGTTDEAAQEAATDAAAVVSGLTGMCRSLGVAAQHVLTASPADAGTEELEYVRRLTECMATLATNHMTVLPDPGLRSAFLEALLGLTRYPSLEVLGAALPAWPGLLRGMGAELPGTFHRPDKGVGSGVWAAQQAAAAVGHAVGGVAGAGGSGGGGAEGGIVKGSCLLPEGAVVALLEASRVWLQQGAGLASGLCTAGVPEAKGDDWEGDFETREELRESWIMLRARCMEVAKLCTTLEPRAAAAAAANHVSTVLGWLAAGGALDASKAVASGAVTADGRSSMDDAIGAALEGAVSFVEPVMQAMPIAGSDVSANAEVVAAVTPALEAMLSQLLAVDLTSPVAVSQLAKLLEALGRAALVRPDAATALLQRLFALLSRLPVEEASRVAPPIRVKAALMAGRTAQAARQRVCAAVLGVCASAPNVRGYHSYVFQN